MMVKVVVVVTLDVILFALRFLLALIDRTRARAAAAAKIVFGRPRPTSTH